MTTFPLVGTDASANLIFRDARGARTPVKVDRHYVVAAAVSRASRGRWVAAVRAITPAHWFKLALIGPGATGHDFGPLHRNAEATGLAVTPDGTRVAVAFRPGTGTDPARVTVVALPGSDAPSQTWTLPIDSGNEVKSLSWSRDGRSLTYIAGYDTGGGLAGDPVTFNIDSGATTLPSTSGWKHMPGCADLVATRISWNDSIVDVLECADGVRLRNVDAMGQRIGGTVGLRGRGCGADLSVIPARKLVLLSWCGQLYAVDDGLRPIMGLVKGS